MKGISTIIATILLLVITIGLAAAAYIFISGLLTSSISKTINVLDVSCIPFGSTNLGNITLILSNDGTMNITDSDLIITVDGQIKSGDFDFNEPIMPHGSAVNTSKSGYATGISHTVVIASSSNSVRTTVWC